jgi:alpha-L-fucosidase
VRFFGDSHQRSAGLFAWYECIGNWGAQSNRTVEFRAVVQLRGDDMKRKCQRISIGMLMLVLLACAGGILAQRETPHERDARMQWWREARFGLFIHWGLYSIPAGAWQGKTNHAEWIRTTAQIPLAEYDKFVGQFNPVRFNADEWVRMAKAAGMKYIVITSKHHDGFCLFDSQYTDFDIAATPFKRDILKELADACRRQGMRICWYHSIMDWHHPDYLPRRDWEKDRPATGAEFNRYVAYMKNQIRELLTKYGDIGVLWFDGEWENTWNQSYGRDLYAYVRSLQPQILVNNRVGAGRSGMEGLTKEGEFGGDFGTPEQQVPATGIPGVDWESCMTTNDNWGYNKNDNHWKSTKTIVQMLADIASKGGNLLLNVGPTSEGLFPQASIDRLREIGQWMDVNGDAIYGTKASPFKKLDWGRCTSKSGDGGTRLYLHVFDWPREGKLVIPGLFNKAKQAYLLADRRKAPLDVSRQEDALVILVPAAAPDPIDSVVVLDVEGKPDVNDPPKIESDFDSFIDKLEVAVTSDRDNVQVRYTLDGSIPSPSSPVSVGKIGLTRTTLLSARCFRGDQAVSGTAQSKFTKVAPRPAVKVDKPAGGVKYAYFEGDWDLLPDFRSLKPAAEGILEGFDLSPRKKPEYFGFEYTGYVNIREDDVYTWFTASDDGSRLYVGDELVVDNDGLHGMREKRGAVALAAGLHPIRVTYFNKTGGLDLQVHYASRKIVKQPIPGGMLLQR